MQHWHEPLTPEVASDALEQFEQNFEMATHISVEFIELYPETMRKHVETVTAGFRQREATKMPRGTPFTCEQLVELDDSLRGLISDFVGVLEAHTGCTSPAEELIWGLVLQHGMGIGITPDSLRRDLEEFTGNFESAIDNARRMVRRYPIEVLGKDCGYEPDQITALKAGHDRDQQQEAFELQTAREGLRRYPSLLVKAKMPEPWRSVIGSHSTKPPQRRNSGVAMTKNESRNWGATPTGYITRGTRNRFDFSGLSDYGYERIFVISCFPCSSHIRGMIAQNFARIDYLLDLALESLRQLIRIFEVKEVFPNGIFQRLVPQGKQRPIDIREASLEVEDVVEVEIMRQRGVERPPLVPEFRFNSRLFRSCGDLRLGYRRTRLP